MKNRKIILSTLVALSLLTTVTGCGTKENKNETTNNNTKTEEKNKMKGKCSAVDCMKQIEITNTIEEINEITGVEGKLTDETKKIYEYDLGDEDKITVEYGSKEVPTIKAEFTRSKVADKNVDLSKSTELKAKVNAGINYEQFKAEIGNVDGIVVEKSETNTKYMWVSKKGGYIKGNFRNSDNLCTFFTGMTDNR